MTRVAQIEALERTTYLERRRGQGTQEVGARVDSRAAREELTNLMRSAERLREMAQTAKKWYYVEWDEAVRARNAALDAARRARTPRGGGASAPVRKQPER